MNDVTILAPLPQSLTEPVLFRGSDLADDGSALLPSALFDRVVTEPGSTAALQPEIYGRRALGYLGTEPMISQRVVNDTAETLAELETRYPAH